jgi:hypothetical protein
MRWNCACAPALGAALLAALSFAADEKKADDGFRDLFNGKDLTGWKFQLQGDAKPDATWSVKDGVIVCTGKPNGYFYTEKPYKNYVIRYDWRYKRPDNLTDEEKFTGNSGLLVHIQGEPKVWPKCIEVQGMNRDHGKLLTVSGAKAVGELKFDAAELKKVRKPVGEWNTTEVVCGKDGEISCKVNGAPISSGKSELTEGQIGFQSEGAEIHFRNIKIKEMK